MSFKTIMQSCLQCTAIALVTLVLHVSSAFAQQQSESSPFANLSQHDVPVADGIESNKGGKLLGSRQGQTASQDVMVTKFGICRWIDNNSTDDLLIPFNSQDEWTAFINGGPTDVRRDACCSATDVTVSATDGQTHTFRIGAGRARGGHPRNVANLSHTFSLTRDDCTTHWNGTQTCNTASWTETYAQTQTCASDGNWSASTVTQTGSPPPLNPPAYIAPLPCGSYAHNSTYYNATGSGVTDRSAECAHGGDLRDTYTLETQMLCWDGTASPTGATRQTNVTTLGACSAAPTVGPWTEGGWGTCNPSGTCGSGTQTRTISCAYDSCSGPMPADTQSCATGESCGPAGCPAGQARRYGDPTCYPYSLNVQAFNRATSGANFSSMDYLFSSQQPGNWTSQPLVSGGARQVGNAALVCARNGYGTVLSSFGVTNENWNGATWVGFAYTSGDAANPASYTRNYNAGTCNSCGYVTSVLCSDSASVLVPRTYSYIEDSQPTQASDAQTNLPECTGYNFGTVKALSFERKGKPSAGQTGDVPTTCSEPYACHFRYEAAGACSGGWIDLDSGSEWYGAEPPAYGNWQCIYYEPNYWVTSVKSCEPK